MRVRLHLYQPLLSPLKEEISTDSAHDEPSHLHYPWRQTNTPLQKTAARSIGILLISAIGLYIKINLNILSSSIDILPVQL